MGKMAANLDATTQKNVDAWLEGKYDEATKKEIKRLAAEDVATLIDAFYTDLEFGTGGLRGLMGVGTNRMNPYTVRRATQGLANTINTDRVKSETKAVLIGFDTRQQSKDFAQECAKVLAANNIEVYLFDSFRPVALISFALLLKKCNAGILITASHNPKEYNGYKVYWNHGGQVLFPTDHKIIKEVEKITTLEQIKMTDLPHPSVHLIGKEIDNAYLNAIRPLQHTPGENVTHGSELMVVYTPLHGSGIAIVPRALGDWGFSNVTLVQEQTSTDGTFPTVKTPNPEYKENLKLGIDTLQKTKSDILIATDADSDRIGVVILHKDQPTIFSGNQLAALAAEHICRNLKKTHQIPPKPMIVKTIVTTELVQSIARRYSVTCLDVLTGFKYIGEKIAHWEQDALAPVTAHHFLFGAEESFGYLLGTHVRDKDAVVMAALFAEMALHLKREKKTLLDFLYEIYHKYGVYREKLVQLTFEGKEGATKIKKMMEQLRASPPTTIKDIAVTEFEDYLSHTHLYPQTGRHEPIILPKSDVLRFKLADKTKITVRPSGTEPKIKIYAEVTEKRFVQNPPAIDKVIAQCDDRLNALLDHMQRTLVTNP